MLATITWGSDAGGGTACTDSTYAVSIAPAGAVVSGPPMDTPVQTGEPNESPTQALGPLRGRVSYAGTLATVQRPGLVLLLRGARHLAARHQRARAV